MDTLARALNPLLMIALPLALGVSLARRYRVDWRYFGLGALAFFASQVLHIPFNAWVLLPGLTRLGLGPAAQGASAVVFALVIGLSAGIFEESARYLLIRLWPRPERRWENAMMFGAGHGGLEAILTWPAGGLWLFPGPGPQRGSARDRCAGRTARAHPVPA